ncbi:MAG: DUF1624 domain-containing protein [Alistipes sp.]|nr:DUF1624 domain-containing protein [Candidatus Alistipes equi]
MTQNSKRFIAIDVLRGLTIAMMLIVNNPGTYSYVFSPLRHSKWAGCTPTDLVFPFFLFIVGASMFFSFSKMEQLGTKEKLQKIFRRGILIFLIGLALNAFPFYPISRNPELTFSQNYLNYLHGIRIFGVLQRIAMCYILGAVIVLWLKKPKKIILSMILLALGHYLILLFGGDASFPEVNGAKGVFSLLGQCSGPIDISLVGESHVYHGYGQPFDPEGLLGTLSGTCTLLLGFLSGVIIRKSKTSQMGALRILAWGAPLIIAGLFIGIWYPICKPLWTGSFVLFTAGWSMVLLSLCIYLIDIKKRVSLLTPFRALGQNPLFCYVLAGVMVRILKRMVTWSETIQTPEGGTLEEHWNALGWFYEKVCVPIVGTNNEISSLLYALCLVGVFILLAMVLYKKRIIIKL